MGKYHLELLYSGIPCLSERGGKIFKSSFSDTAENIKMGLNTAQKLILNKHNVIYQLYLKKEETDTNIWETR